MKITTYPAKSQSSSSPDLRCETDALGSRQLPAGCLYGIHTMRAIENFDLAGHPVHAELILAFGAVKLACARTNRQLGVWPDDTEGRAKAAALEQACGEMSTGLLSQQVVVDSLQGGAGTSTNMNINEVLANRALEILGRPHGEYAVISPLEDVNRHQSTNDTFPTALRLAAISMLRGLEQSVLRLHEAFQLKAKALAHVVKVGRTQLQDAVLTTLGREMGAYAEAFKRDHGRISKCEERLHHVNLGGTAIGTGLGAPRQFTLRVVEELRDLTAINFVQHEDLVEGTQNTDVFVEVSGILKALAVSLLKISTDLRLLASGPEAGLAEIKLPARQAGSTIMPGKVNPVIPEAVAQAAMLVMSNDAAITLAAASGTLELNPFLPLIAHTLFQNLDLLRRACDCFREKCIAELEADEGQCRRWVAASTTATVTALTPAIGYAHALDIIRAAREKGISIRAAALASSYVTPEQFDQLTTPMAQ